VFTVRYGLSLKFASPGVVLILIYLLTAIGLTPDGVAVIQLILWFAQSWHNSS
jgi:hypothetical protein